MKQPITLVAVALLAVTAVSVTGAVALADSASPSGEGDRTTGGGTIGGMVTTGRATSAHHGAPVEGAHVIAAPVHPRPHDLGAILPMLGDTERPACHHRARSLTDKNGVFKLEGLCLGRYVVVVNKAGFRLGWYDGDDDDHLPDIITLSPDHPSTRVSIALTPLRNSGR
jgi:hypothetical protein